MGTGMAPVISNVELPGMEPIRRGKVRDLMAMLRQIRRQLADSKDLPAYTVASNRTLEDMARLRPTTKRAMLAVHGMGPRRWERWGSPFLDAIKTWIDEAPAS